MKTKDYIIRWHHLPQSRVSVCQISNTTRLLKEGIAYCAPTDSFDKNKGRRVSLARALKALNLPKEVRMEFWEAYREMTKVPRW